MRTSDVRWFEEHLSSDFLNSNPDGSLVDRAGFLAQIARPIDSPARGATPTYGYAAMGAGAALQPT